MMQITGTACVYRNDDVTRASKRTPERDEYSRDQRRSLFVVQHGLEHILLVRLRPHLDRKFGDLDGAGVQHGDLTKDGVARLANRLDRSAEAFVRRSLSNERTKTRARFTA